jgi:hypothetical protein
MRDANGKTHDVAVLRGDGIGREVIPPALEILEAAGRRHDFGFRWAEHDWSCDRYVKTGRMMPEDGIAQVRDKDAILLGAVGAPEVPDHVSLWGMLITLRRELRQYACLRPVRLLKGVRSPLAGRTPGDIDILIVRKNNEGEYSRIGGRLYEGMDEELCDPECRLHAQGRRPHPPLRIRAGSQTQAQASHFRHQIQWRLLFHALLGRALRDHVAPVSRRDDREAPYRHYNRRIRVAARTVSMWSWAPISLATS